MTAKTAAERKAAERERRAAADLHEVRGIWAPKELHTAIRDQAAKAVKRQTKGKP